MRCFLCGHGFVEGEEPWLMFDQRLGEDGQLECSLAEILSTALERKIIETEAHSTLLCDACNADVLEYESLEKRFFELRQRILRSYNNNANIQNLEDGLFTSELDLEGNLVATKQNVVNLQSEVSVKPEYVNASALDLVEEVHEDKSSSIAAAAEADDDNYGFGVFDEDVSQVSLPAGVLHLSDDLVALPVSQSPVIMKEADLDQDIIVYDVEIDQNFQAGFNDETKSVDSPGMSEFCDNSADDEELSCLTEEGILTTASSASSTTGNAALDTGRCTLNPVCKQIGNKFVCLLCKDPERTERKVLSEHLQNVHNCRFHLCGVCNHGYVSRQSLKEHMDAEHTANGAGTEFICEICQRTFMNYRLLRIHKRIHLNTIKPYECQVCHKKYASKNMLEEHMNTHTGRRPYKCPECHKDFASKCTLQTHVKIHTERQRPFQCDQCEKAFLNQQNLAQHKKLHVAVKAFVCEVCSKAFYTQHNLNVHKIVHSGQRPFICRTCGKAFARRPEIKDHERTHTGERPFKCDLCPMAFAQRSNLMSHKKSTHLNEKLHKCKQCDRSFKRRRLLDYHIQAVHTGERPHKCDICGAGFVYPEHYKKHMFIHSGHKPYACEVCGKQFNSRDNRNAHRFVHSEKKLYECLECGAGFMRKPLLLAHMKHTKHANDTIIVNQPQFTQHPVQTITDSVFTLIGENGEQSVVVSGSDSLEEIMESTKAILGHVEGVGDGTDVMTAVSGQLMRDDIGEVKYLQFEDLEKDGSHTLTWVDIGGADKE